MTYLSHRNLQPRPENRRVKSRIEDGCIVTRLKMSPILPKENSI